MFLLDLLQEMRAVLWEASGNEGGSYIRHCEIEEREKFVIDTPACLLVRKVFLTVVICCLRVALSS